MNLQSSCSLLHHKALIPKFPQTHFENKNHDRSYFRLQKRTPFVQNGLKFIPSLKRGLIVYASKSNPPEKLNNNVRESKSMTVIPSYGSEQFRGKAGSVSFHGLSHQVIEERKLVSAPFEAEGRSILWFLAPVALISSILIPRFFIDTAVDDLINNITLAEIVSSIFSEVMFYIGLATFLGVTHKVQKPYLEFSAKRWSLITGLKGYLTFASFIMGLKILGPLAMLYALWPSLGVLQPLVALGPFLVGCGVQYVFEAFLEKNESSTWPLAKIIFEVYRLYQLTRAVNFVDKLMYAMRDAPVTPELLDRNGALVALIVTFQFLGILTLWSLFTFLQRLFPSRPVGENY